MSMQEFFTRKRANEGILLPLSLPDGTPTEHWITLRGIDSDAFRAAEAASRRKAMEIAQLPSEEERREAIEQEKLLMLSSLISGWSFEEPPTSENIINFFKEAPQIADAVDRAAVDRARFFAQRSSDSTNLPDPNSSSNESPTDQKSR